MRGATVTDRSSVPERPLVVCDNANVRDMGDGREHFGPLEVAGPDGCELIVNVNDLKGRLCSWCAGGNLR